MDDRDDAVRVLLAEDDAVSARFLREALMLLGAHVETVADGPAALAAASARRFDLLLLDLGLPGLDGAGVLRALRTREGAASRAARALATTAGRPDAARLAAAGFTGLLRKPARVDDLAAVLGGHVAVADDPKPRPVLDDAAALAALGDPEAVTDLRRLLAAELPAQVSALHAALRATDSRAARAILHRLHASTRFCGAAALAAAGNRLGQALDDAAPDPLRRQALDVLAAAAAAYIAEVSR